ncbi:hypothetical protein [Deinococcus sp. QL22]|uniref:hypothetical protein n=1 Tax=Deinococcus sp. QL22 TaxID=2939437 RepID=UPI002017C0B5|nr:hypothetical protein [Deinococcus sp. QL22]UQN06484.1 hypothetical protein M1R55_00775 [Deinococcus sp. QL22]
MTEHPLPTPTEVTSMRLKVTTYLGSIVHYESGLKTKWYLELWDVMSPQAVAVPVPPGELQQYGVPVWDAGHSSDSDSSLRWDYVTMGSDDPEINPEGGVRPHTLLTLPIGPVDARAARTYLSICAAQIPGTFHPHVSVPPSVPDGEGSHS